MAATPAAAARDPPPAEVRRRISKTGGGAGPARDAAEERPPVNKKVKLAYPGTTTGIINSAAEETPRFVGGDWRMGGDRMAPQHNNPHAPPPPPTVGLATANIGASTTGRATQTTAQRFLDPKSLQNLRETISQQFDIEILLKHRELGLIEQEIAKTQICIEQLRRCTIKPYQSPEKSLEPYIPDAKELENGPPDYSPPHWSVVNGPYTRHYQQWLLPDPTFDGYGPEGPPVVLPAGKSTRSQKTVEPTQTYTVSGRPQRQSVMKVQARSGTGVQQCLFRKSDGTTVRLECLDCKRSDFSSAQGFINHCRIAHQREYASHEAAALACGQPVEETEEGFALYPRNPVDPPSRNTRQTQQTISPQPSYSSTPRGSISGPSGAVPGLPPPKVAPTPKNKTTAAQRKSGNRGTRAVMTTASRPAEGSRRPPTPPIDALTFKTPHLEGLLKRKKIEVDLATMVKEVKGERINWDDHASSEEDDDESDQSETPVSSGKDTDGDTVMTDGPAGREESRQVRSPLETGAHTAMVTAQPESLTVASVRNMSGGSPTPFSAQLPSPPEPRTQTQPPPAIDISLGHPKQASAMMQSPIEEKKPLLSLTGMGMDGSYDYDASSSDDEDGYKSDADVHEDVEMEVESASSSSSVGDHTTIHDTGFGMRTPPVPVERMGRSSSPQSPRPVASHVAVVAPISPALSIAADEIMRDMVTPVRTLMQTPTPLMTPISPAAAAAANNSKQVRFVMPNSKNGMRKNPSGVLETGLAKMKSGNARKPSDVFGSQEKR